MARRRRGPAWTWLVLLFVVIGGANMLSRPSADRPPISGAPANLPAEPRTPVEPQPQVSVAPSVEVGTPLATPIIGYVTASNLNVRRSPSTTSEVLLSVPRGTRITATAAAEGWLGVVLTDGSLGWVSADYVSDDDPGAVESEPVVQAQTAPAAPAYDRNAIVQAIIQESIWATGGSCPCPYNSDRAGRRCGGRSAYSRPGGASPICFPEQVTQQMIERYTWLANECRPIGPVGTLRTAGRADPGSGSRSRAMASG